MSKFEYERNNTPLAQFAMNLAELCDNALCEEAHTKILGKVNKLYEDKAIVSLVDRYAGLLHDGRLYQQKAKQATDGEYYEKWAEQAYEEASVVSWILAEML